MYSSIYIFGREIGTYGLLFVIGLLLCGLLGAVLAKKKFNIMYEDIILLMVTLGIGLLIGGHLLYGITNLHNMVGAFAKMESFDISRIFMILVATFGGNVFYGGLLGSILAIYIYTKYSKSLVRSQVFDVYAVCIPLFHCFGRVGCFLGGCCYGIECSIGFTAHGNKYLPELNGVSRFPVQLLEAFLNLCIFALVLYLFKKNKFSSKLIYVYLVCYSVVRFCDEFLRGDEIRGRLLCFSTSQWISIAILIFVIARAIIKKRNAKQNEDAE